MKSLTIFALCAMLCIGCGSSRSNSAQSPDKSKPSTQQQEDVVLASLKVALSAQDEDPNSAATPQNASRTKTAPTQRVKSVSEAKTVSPTSSAPSDKLVPYRDYEPLPDKPVAKAKDGEPIPNGLLFDTRTGRRYIGIRFSPENGSKLEKLDNRTDVKAKDAKVFSPTTGSYYTTGKFCPIHGVPLKMVRF